MASRRLAISFLCDDSAPATQQPPSASPPSHPIPSAQPSDLEPTPLSRSDHSNYFRDVQDVLELTGNPLAYSNQPRDPASSHLAAPATSMRRRGSPSVPDAPVVPSSALESRSVPLNYIGDHGDGERESLRPSHSTRSTALPFDPTRSPRYSREEPQHYSSHNIHQYSYTPPSANFATSPYSSHSRPGSSSSAVPASHSPVVSYRYSQSPEQLRISPLRSPVIPYTQLQSRSSMSPTHAPRADTTSPSNYFYTQPQLNRAPLSIQTYQLSSNTFPSESAQSSSYPYLPTHTTQQSKSSSTYAPTLSPSFSRPQVQSPLSGLDALVQAATEERRRLSAGSESGGVSAMRTSLSPVADRSAASDYASYPDHHQLQYQQTYRMQSPVIPESARIVDEEPPRKRRRSTASPSRISNIYDLTLKTVDPPCVQPPGHADEHFTVNKSPLWNRTSPVRDEPRKTEKNKTEKRAQIVGSSKNVKQEVRGNDVGEQDAHEWLMEQYGASSRSSQSSSPFPSPRISPTSVDRGKDSVSRPGTAQSLPTPASLSEVVSLDSPKVASKKSSPSTPTRALEEALVEHDIPVKRERSVVVDNDVDRDIEGALGLVDEQSAPSVHSLDVEDELLSLVDDHKEQKPPSRNSPEARRRHNVPSPVLKSSHEHLPAPITSNHKRSASRTAPPPHPSIPERQLMPPPTTIGSSTVNKDKASSLDRPRASGKKEDTTKPATPDVPVPASSSKKKAPGPAPPKPKPPPKPKKKAGSGATVKSRVKALQEEEAAASPAPARGKKASPATAGSKSSRAKSGSIARSRSTSVLPPRPGSVAPEVDGLRREEEEGPEEEEDHAAKINDDKLYCICKSKYDDDKVMIACDRCDEWYHTACVNMPDLEVDLVDTFICPPCVQSNPHLSLQTTYKRRCFAGLQHPSPSSLSACHKPARGLLSKYCSDECGIKYMRLRIDAWAARGGSTRQLWNTIKNAERREGVVVRADAVEQWKNDPKAAIAEAVDLDSKVKSEREVERLRTRLDMVMKVREQLKKEMEVVIWRQKLVELASDRADRVDECGWDQRLCFDDDEWAEFGAGVLESYEEAQGVGGQESESGMQVDGPIAEHGEWWCKGKRKCDRHAGWQKLRIAEIDFEKEIKEASIAKFTSQERELRKRIEDIFEPKGKLTSSPSTNSKPAVNGHAQAPPKVNGELKKGKKRKAEAI